LPGPSGLTLRIDEGRLEKVVFRGRLTLKTLRFKLGLPIPFDVYNRAQLEREGAALAESLGLTGLRFELVPTMQVDHLGPQLDDLGAIQGHSLIAPKRPFELHVFFDQLSWRSGLGLDLRLSTYNGVELGLHYEREGALLHRDRFLVSGSGGSRIASRLLDDRSYLVLSRAFADLRWYSPPMWKERIRVFLWVDAELSGRQRPDLRLEHYLNLDLESSLDLRVQAAKRWTLDLGGGLRRRSTFALRESGLPEDPIDPHAIASARLDPFAFLLWKGIFETGGVREDRQHTLTVELRRFFSDVPGPYARLGYAWQKVFSLGWHDLWLRSRGLWMRGAVPFHDEAPLGGAFLRGAFQELYLRRAASFEVEWRFSVTRDLYKIGAFVDGAAFGELDRNSKHAPLGLGLAFGPSFHALIIDMLQLDLYVAFGFASKGRFDTGAAVALKKVY